MSVLSGVVPFFGRFRSRPGQIARVLAADSRRSFWALADQGIASFGSFGVNILLGRAFERMHRVGEFGNYWTLLELMIFLNGLQGAFIIYPMTVRAAGSDRATLSRMASSSLLLTLVIWPILAATLLITSFFARIPFSVGLWAATALGFWQLQETTRRTLMAHLKFRTAILGDSISFVGQVLVVGLLAWSGRLTLTTTFQAMAFTSALAAIVQAMQIKLSRVNSAEFPSYGSECWNLGRWMLAGNLTNFIVGPLFAWNLRYWLGDAMMGVNYALSNLLRVANPLGFAIASMIVPNAARVVKEEGLDAAEKVLIRNSAMGLTLLVPYLTFLFIFPQFALAVLYGWHSTEYLNWAGALRISSIATLLSFTGIVTGAYLNGIEKSRYATYGSVMYSLAAVVAGMPLVAFFGLYGAAFGWVIAAATITATNLYFIRKVKESASQPDHQEELHPAPLPFVAPAAEARKRMTSAA